MGPNNVLLGDITGADLPQKPVDEIALSELKNKARYNKSKEFEELKSHMVERILYYQRFLPDGRRIVDVPKEDLEGMWIVANTIINELTQVINGYENASEMVEEMAKADGSK